jgi:small redox-active disulfide protein 2
MKKIKIEIIGSGCKKCKTLFELTKEVTQELNINDPVLYSTDITKIINMGIMQSPVLTIDDKPVLIGILPNKEKLKEIISKNILDESLKKDKEDGSNYNKEGYCSCGGQC